MQHMLQLPVTGDLMFCNYIWRDPKNNVERYVGWGGSVDRAYGHLKKTHNRQLDRMLQKRIKEGFDLQPEVIICPIQSENYAKLIECCWIEKYGREDLGLGTLFNHTDGGDGVRGYKQTPEAKAAQDAGNLRRYADPASHEALAIGQAKRNARPGEKERRLASATKRWAVPDQHHSPQAVENNRAAQLVAQNEPHVLQRNRETHLGLRKFTSPEGQVKMFKPGERPLDNWTPAKHSRYK